MDLPLTIDNGLGERLTFERIERSDDGERVIVRNDVAPGAGPPMHVHHQQAESLTVVEGRLGYRIAGAEPRSADPGETVLFEPGVAHAFWAEGEERLRCTGWISPPHNVVWFLREVYRSTEASGKGKPDDLDVAWLLHRYRDEFAILEIPAFVQTFVFPILRLVGAATGRYRKYHDAPPPIAAGHARPSPTLEGAA